MCTVCGCDGDGAAIEGHEHVHHHGHTPEHAQDHTHGEDGALDYGKGAAGVHVPGQSQARLIEIEQDILSKNDHLAAHNRKRFARDELISINMMSSPGSGKTTLLVETLKALGDTPAAVIEGDQQTANDAQRIRETGAPAIQINTGKGCHLDAQMVGDALNHLKPAPGSLLFIENVGNLVCPAAFDLGETGRVVLASVTEGEDKPLKYPEMFAGADLMIVTKTDLLPYLNFDVELLIANARKVQPRLDVIKTSATGAPGIQSWLTWLEGLSLQQHMAAE
ncbi:MAG: hydrogenase nickel incorporation protein HypB [Pseudomonadota bacterium]